MNTKLNGGLYSDDFSATLFKPTTHVDSEPQAMFWDRCSRLKRSQID